MIVPTHGAPTLDLWTANLPYQLQLFGVTERCSTKWWMRTRMRSFSTE